MLLFAPDRKPRVLLVISSGIATFGLGLQYAYYKTFSQFWLSDDEGSMMLRVSEFLHNPDRYDDVAGMYGPFYYLVKSAIYLVLGQEVSHDVNRLTTIVLWGLIAAAASFFVYRCTRSFVFTACTQLLLVLHLTPLANEPGHPQELSLLLSVTALVLTTYLGQLRHRIIALVGLGGLLGAVLLIKVNVGLYLVLPLSIVAAAALPRGRIQSSLELLLRISTLVLPATIMHRHLGLPWAQFYCATSTLTLASCLLLFRRGRSTNGLLSWPDIATALLAGVATIATTCGIIIGLGNSLDAIVNSVIRRAASLSGAFHLPAPATPELAGFALLSFLAAIGYALATTRTFVPRVIDKLMAGSALAYGAYVLWRAYTDGGSLALDPIALPFLWLVLTANSDSAMPAAESFPRKALVLVAALQSMTAYPVYGSQKFWAGMLLIPAAAVCLADATRTLEPLLRQRRRHSPQRLPKGWLKYGVPLFLYGCMLALYARAANLRELRTDYHASVRLELPGAELVRQKPDRAEFLRWAADRLRNNCDAFVAAPGLPSMYFWTQMPPPGIVTAGWVLNLDSAAQTAIVAQMRTKARACAIVNAGMVRSWNVLRPTYVKMPLYRYIQDDLRPVETRPPFTLYASPQLQLDPPGRTPRP